MSTVIIETRRSKGTHKADLTKLSKEDIKLVLSHFNSSSYVAVKNYRTDAREIKFHIMKERGVVNYCLNTTLSDDDLKAIGFSKTEKNNWHLTQQGCTIDSVYDVEVKEPVKKIESKKTKAEKKEKAESVDSSKKKPLPAPTKKSVEKAESSEEDMTETVSA
jgi:hypothetical protein